MAIPLQTKWVGGDQGRHVRHWRLRGDTVEPAKARSDSGRFTLAEPWAERSRARDLVNQGVNPARDRQLARLHRLQRVVFGKIGPLPTSQVTPMHVLDVLTSAARQDGPSVAAEAKRSMASVFDLAVATLRTVRDPVYPVRRALPPNKTQDKPALEVDEIGQLLHEIARHGSRHQALSAFRLM